MPDPNGLYAKFLRKNPSFAECEVISPVVLDGNRNLITPDHYGQLIHLAPVSVTAYIRLWEIPPTRGRPNGSRAYQLMLKELQLLPCIPQDFPPSPPPLPPSPSSKGKGKRPIATTGQPPSDTQGPSTPKKSRTGLRSGRNMQSSGDTQMDDN